METTAAVPTCACSTGRWILTARKWIAKCKGHQKRIALSVPFESYSGTSFWSAHLLFRLAFPSPGASVRENFFFNRSCISENGPGTQRETWSSTGGIASVAGQTAATTRGRGCAVTPHFCAPLRLPLSCAGADMSGLYCLHLPRKTKGKVRRHTRRPHTVVREGHIAHRTLIYRKIKQKKKTAVPW